MSKHETGSKKVFHCFKEINALMNRFNMMHQIFMVLQVVVLSLVCFSACYEEGKKQPGYFFFFRFCFSRGLLLKLLNTVVV